jgi:CheY-like chemotaxis protein
MNEKFKLLLFIDDDVATNFYHKIIVNSSGVCEKHVFFEKAKDALDYFNSVENNNQIPDIIFLDINMPRIDGWTFLNLFSDIPLERHPRIIMLTTSLSTIERERANNHPQVYKLLHKSLTEEHLHELRSALLSVA